MRILLTGAAGFLGSHLCDRLITEGHQVVGMDNFITGSPENLAQLEGTGQFRLIEQDVSEAFDVPGPLEAVLHFASPASPNPASPYGYPNLPVETLRAGSLGTLNTLELARRTGARYLLASTSEIYGDPLEHPQSESYWGHVDPVGLRSMYDEAKRFAEAAVMAYHRKHKVDTRIVRIFNTYGPRMRPDDGRAIPNLIHQALRGEALTIYGNGSQTRSFCYVDDLVEGLYRLLLSGEHDPVNLGNDREMSIFELAQAVNRITGNGAGLVYRPNDRLGSDPQRRRPDIRRARQLLEWEPRIPLEEGLPRTVDYFREKMRQG
jgi:dTDP-glucose 4,6-dehydratase